MRWKRSWNRSTHQQIKKSEKFQNSTNAFHVSRVWNVGGAPQCADS